MKEILIGRKKEVEELQNWVESQRAEFIAVYGRRRVGKTFLVRKALGNKILFHFSGSFGQKRKEQLVNFAFALREQSGKNDWPVPENWTIAFQQLKSFIEAGRKKNKVIFFDELPWIDTPKSGFLQALEYFWNSWASWRDDVKLIVCGSATSWIINKIIKNKGGLHNRLTKKILVKPFDLKECEEYFKLYGFRYSRMQVAETYMVMGGIPFYFSLMNKGESVAKNIDRLFFSNDAPLKDEFNDLYNALFLKSQNYISVVKALAEKGYGLTRQEILEKTKLQNNGEFSKIMEDLELCGMIRSYLPYEKSHSKFPAIGRTSRLTLYQLIDFYSLFYLRFGRNKLLKNENFWSTHTNSPQLNAWRGVSFEMLCLCQIHQLKKALGIEDVSTQIYSWTGQYDGEKAQIDLIIDRADSTLNICEMKFSFKEFSIDKKYAETLQHKLDIFIEATGLKKNLILTMITSKGLKENKYSDIVQREVTLDQLFE